MSESNSAPRFDVRPYRSEGGAPLIGVAVTSAALFVGAVVIGWMASFIGQWFYLIVLFPFAIGLAVGGLGNLGAKYGKVRSGFVAVVLGLLGGVGAMTAMHYADYQRLLTDVDAEKPGARQEALAKGFTFLKFIDLEATQGVEIASTHGGGKGMNLGYYGSYIYWLVEVAIVAFMTMALVLARASEPFCRSCNQWKQPRTLGELPLEPQRAKAALEAGDATALSVADPPETAIPVSVVASVCPTCAHEGEVDMKLQYTTTNAKNEATTLELTHVTYPGHALPVFEAVCRPPAERET